MISSALWLLAEAPITTKFEWGRIQSNYDWWIYGGILLAILAPLLWIYRRDAGELPWFLRLGLPLLRTLVLIGLLVVYLQPRWRSEREEHLDSRVLMLVDTSLSMARPTPTRPADVRASRACNRWPPGWTIPSSSPACGRSTMSPSCPSTASWKKIAAWSCPWSLHAGTKDESEDVSGGRRRRRHPRHPRHRQVPRCPPVWRKHLVPGGTDTRLGEALEQLLREERSTPVSGIVLISDGGLNAGASPDTAMELARESHIPIYTDRRRLGKEARRRPRGRLQCSLPGLSRRSLLGGRFDPGLRHEGANGAGGALGPRRRRRQGPFPPRPGKRSSIPPRRSCWATARPCPSSSSCRPRKWASTCSACG